MAKLNNNVDIEALKLDIEAMKNASSKEEVEAIKAKYAAAVSEMNEQKAKEASPEATKKAPAKKTTAKKPETKSTKSPAKKTVAKAPAKKETEDKEPEKKGRQYNGKYEVYQDIDGFKYRLKASNGEVLVVSEAYTTRDGVMRAIEAVKRNVETGVVKVSADKRGKFRFKLTSKNNKVLTVSANYSAEKSAVRASESFKKFALKADIVEIELPASEMATATEIVIGTIEDKKGGKFVVENFNGEFSWDLKASNGQILCQKDGYTSKKGCTESIETFKANVAAGVFKCIKDKNNSYFYKLYSSDNRVCAAGESFSSKASAENQAKSVCSFVKFAEVVVVDSKEEK